MKAENIRNVAVDLQIEKVHILVDPRGTFTVNLDLLWRLGNGFPVPQETKMLPMPAELQKTIKALVEILTETAYNVILPENKKTGNTK